MPKSGSRPSVPPPTLSEVVAAVVTLLASILVIAVVVTATIASSYCFALKVGMREENFLSDMIVANASIVIHLTLERFLRRAGRSARCLGAYLSFLLRWLFGRN
jgi:hypothetical protein